MTIEERIGRLVSKIDMALTGESRVEANAAIFSIAASQLDKMVAEDPSNDAVNELNIMLSMFAVAYTNAVDKETSRAKSAFN